MRFITFVVIFTLFIIIQINAQDIYNRDRTYNPVGNYPPYNLDGNLPQNADRYPYNTGDRYYPYSPGSGYSPNINTYGTFDRNRDPNARYQYNSDTVKLPGVLGEWRPDLQGKQRPESLNLKREVSVTTNQGSVGGFIVYLYDNPFPDSGFRPDNLYVEKIQRDVSVFLGIPYALPPTNEGRFKPPRPHPSWQFLHAVDFRPACPQPVEFVGKKKGIQEMNEDCLYLNIFSPSTKSNVPKKYAVMVYIHGGEFYRGASNLFPGHIMSAFYDVVVVTFNYRLGALGFLSTGDINSPGNYGMLDQSMAIRWIYDNIEFFNGDRNSITLFGPDAGAASAGLLMVNPRTRDLISKVIAQSGSALADWALIHDKYRAQNTSRVFGKHLGCNADSTWKLVACLKGRSFYELGKAEFKPDIGIMSWGPVLDTNITIPDGVLYDGWHHADWYFANETVESLIKDRRFNRNLQYMSGVATQEAAYFVYNNKSLSPNFNIDQKLMNQKMKELVQQYNYTLNPNGTYEALKFMYTHWPDPSCESCVRTQYINLLSDFLYVAPHDKITKLLLKENVKVYTYVQNTTVETFGFPEWRKAPHDIEYYFLTGAPFLDSEMQPFEDRRDRNAWTTNDRNMSHFFMKAYTNFAKYGDPTQTQILGIHFEPATIKELKYLNINTTFNSSILLNYRQMECAFWSYYLPTVFSNQLPIYYPYPDWWWSQSSPIHIAFWSISLICTLLVIVTMILCILWNNSRREIEHYYNEDFLTLEKESEINGGIESRAESSTNIYEFRDTPSLLPPTKTRPSSSLGGKTMSASSLRTESAMSQDNPLSSSPRAATRRKEFINRPQTFELKNGIPQTAV